MTASPLDQMIRLAAFAENSAAMRRNASRRGEVEAIVLTATAGDLSAAMRERAQHIREFAETEGPLKLQNQADPSARANALLCFLLASAWRSPSDLHLHFWFSETLRAVLDECRRAGDTTWQECRSLAQCAISAGINLRQRTEAEALAASRIFAAEPRMGPLGHDGADDPRRVLSGMSFVLSFSGMNLERTFRLAIGAAQDAPRLAAELALLVGAYFQDDLKASHPRLAELVRESVRLTHDERQSEHGSH